MREQWVVLILLLVTTSALAQRSCKGRCGTNDGSPSCQCEATCIDFGDCCQDFELHCLTCVGRCGARFDKNQACQCNTNCAQFKNCCEDHATSCQPNISQGQSSISSGPITTADQQTKGSCVGRCGARFDKNQACQCNTNCAQFKNCCEDHATSCQPRRSQGQSRVSSGPITTADLQTFTEELLQKDTNNVAPQLRINRQGQTNSRAADDKAQGPLMSIPSSALTGPTIVAFRTLLNNYDPNVAVKEVENNAETQEQNTFLNEIMKTQVMKNTEDFLTTKGKIRRPLRDVLKEIWFTLYRRAGRIEGSSGFEHTFIGELKDGKVSGFHNWIQFGHEETDGDLDYKGFTKYVNLGNKGQIIKGRFDWLTDSKPAGSLFVGTSPELEMALYTVCFLVKPDQKCQVKLNNKKVNIQTWTQNYKGKKLIGSAYPDI